MAFLFLWYGCAKTTLPNPAPPGPSGQSRPSSSSAAVDALNRQIEAFNATRSTNAGVVPIHQRVSRVERDSALNQLAAFDQNGRIFLMLKQLPDGRFKGVLEQEYHEAAGSGPDGSHSWGSVMAEFFLDKGTF